LLYPGEYKHDAIAISDLLTRLAGKGIPQDCRLLVCPEIRSVEVLLNHLESIDVAVASRFHGTLLPLTLGKPCIALSYHAKVSDLMCEYEQQEFLFDIDGCEIEQLKRSFEMLWARRRQISAYLVDASNRHRQLLAEQWARLASGWKG